MSNVNASYKYTLNNLNGRAIQKTYIGTYHAYSIDRHYDDEGRRTGDIIFRGDINNNDNTITYSPNDPRKRMTLPRFGHCQTLESYSYNGNHYFLIAMKWNPNSAPWYWATQIGRIQFIPDLYRDVSNNDYTNMSRISHLNFANIHDTNFGPVERTDAALTSDRSRIVIATRNIYGNTQYTLLNNDLVNQVWDRRPNIATPAWNRGIQNAIINSFTVRHVKKHLPHHSMQGLDISDGNKLYIIGGKTHPDMLVTPFNSYDFTHRPFTYIQHNWGTSTAEPEGIQLKGRYLYFGALINGKKNRIYTIPKSEF